VACDLDNSIELMLGHTSLAQALKLTLAHVWMLGGYTGSE